MSKRLTIIVGEIYKNLKVLEEVEAHGKYRRFKTECIKCGIVKDKYMYLLFSSKTGCSCTRKSTGPRGSKYTSLQKRLLHVYNGINARCNNEKYRQYNLYGGRGIKCEWNNFIDFWDDMSGSYLEGLSIDRIENNGNYCKENCKWSTVTEQNNNKRNNIILEGGITLTQWCREKGVFGRYKLFYANYKKGISLQETLSRVPTFAILKELKGDVSVMKKYASFTVGQYTLSGNFIKKGLVGNISRKLGINIDMFKNTILNGQDEFLGYKWLVIGNSTLNAKKICNG